jgi:predicted HTH transcriptional regulator
MSDKVSDKMSDKQEMSDKKYVERILEYLDKNGEITAAITAEIISRSQVTARRILRNLICENILDAIGGNKNRKYLRKRGRK